MYVCMPTLSTEPTSRRHARYSKETRSRDITRFNALIPFLGSVSFGVPKMFPAPFDWFSKTQPFNSPVGTEA